jgi:hypothetical protein
MRKLTAIVLVISLAFGALAFAGTLTDKEQGLIASGKDQTRMERSYNLRDMRPNQLIVEFGPPLYVGAAYSYNINQMFAIKAGAGSTMPGFAGELALDVYILPTTIAPYAEGGIVYYGEFSDSIIAATVGGGVDVELDNAMVVRFGIDWVRSLSNAGAPFQTAVYNGSVNWFMMSGGLGFRF